MSGRRSLASRERGRGVLRTAGPVPSAALVVLVVVVIAFAAPVPASGVGDAGDRPGLVVSGDSSGDRISDAASGRIEGAEADRMDLFVVIVYGENVDPLTDRELREFRAAWERMAVGPDREGVTVHVRQRHLDREVHFDGEPEDGQFRAWYQRYVPDGRQCLDHLVVAGEVHHDRYGGRGDAPGHVSVVDYTDRRRSPDGHTSARVASTIHELLHNVVGEFDDGSHHTEGGWLHGSGGDHLDGDQYLSADTRQKLARDGFESSDHYGC